MQRRDDGKKIITAWKVLHGHYPIYQKETNIIIWNCAYRKTIQKTFFIFSFTFDRVGGKSLEPGQEN